MGKTRSIGIIAPTLMNELYAKAVDTLEAELDKYGYTMLLTCHRGNKEMELRCVRALLEQRVDGLAIIGSHHHSEVFALIHKHNVPYALMWAIDRNGIHPTVGYDNRLAMRRLTSFLVGLGHREFAVLPGPLETQDVAAQRLAGVKDVLHENRITLRKEMVLPTPYDTSAVLQATRKCMTGERMPTALICINDFLAVAAMAECRTLGLSIPEDLSVTGFGDWQIAELITPTLTTMRSNPVHIGELTARNLITQIDGVAQFQDLQVEFEPELVIRESTAKKVG
jgi:LacI family transcriptional regulator